MLLRTAIFILAIINNGNAQPMEYDIKEEQPTIFYKNFRSKKQNSEERELDVRRICHENVNRNNKRQASNKYRITYLAIYGKTKAKRRIKYLGKRGNTNITLNKENQVKTKRRRGSKYK